MPFQIEPESISSPGYGDTSYLFLEGGEEDNDRTAVKWNQFHTTTKRLAP